MLARNHVFTLLAMENSGSPVALVAGFTNRSLQITITSVIMCLSWSVRLLTAFKTSAKQLICASLIDTFKISKPCPTKGRHIACPKYSKWRNQFTAYHNAHWRKSSLIIAYLWKQLNSNFSIAFFPKLLGGLKPPRPPGPPAPRSLQLSMGNRWVIDE